MSTGPINEIIVSLTNIVRKTEQGKVFFDNTEEGENRFGDWQHILLDCAEIIHKTWDENNNGYCEKAIDIFEETVKAVLIPQKEKA